MRGLHWWAIALVALMPASATAWTCDDGEEIEDGYECDDFEDCADGSDEMYCEMTEEEGGETWEEEGGEATEEEGGEEGGDMWSCDDGELIDAV